MQFVFTGMYYRVCQAQCDVNPGQHDQHRSVFANHHSRDTRRVKQCRRLELPLAVVIIPDHTQVVSSFWKALIEGTGVASAHYHQQAPNRRLVGLLGREGVPVLDLLPAFNAQPRREELYLPIDKHWTSSGHALASATAAEFVERLIVDNLRGSRLARPTRTDGLG